MEKTIRKENNLVSFMQAYLLSLGGLNQIMGIFLEKSDGIMVMNLIPLAALMMLHFITSDKKRDLNMSKKGLLFVYYIVSVIVVYKYAFRHTTYSYTYALVYCFVPVYLSFYKVNVEKILKYMMLFSVLVLPISGEFFEKGGFYYETIGMSTTYNILPFVIAAALHFWYYKKNAGLLTWIGYAINIYYLIQIVLYGNRGPLIALVAFGLLLLLHKAVSETRMNKNALRTMIVTILAGALLIYVINNFVDILIAVDGWLDSFGIEINALTKSIHKLRKGDLSNGRNWILEYTLKGINEHYLVGNGISTILYNSNGAVVYPHNLFYQLWYDLGVVVSVPMFYLVGRAAYITIFKSNLRKDYSVIMILLFTISIPRLCFSTEFWTTIPFWFLIMYTISPNIYGMKDDEDELKDEVVEEETVGKHENF